MQSISQQLSQRAYALVRVQSSDDYKARAKSFPALILQSGLANAVGFALSKGSERGYGLYLSDLARMMNQPDPRTMHTQIIKANLADYRLLTTRALSAACYLKRCAEILIESKPSGGVAQ